MKKEYNSPIVEFIEIGYTSMLALSLNEGGDGGLGTGDKYNRGWSDKQKGDEFRSDWDNIWGEM